MALAFVCPSVGYPTGIKFPHGLVSRKTGRPLLRYIGCYPPGHVLANHLRTLEWNVLAIVNDDPYGRHEPVTGYQFCRNDGLAAVHLWHQNTPYYRREHEELGEDRCMRLLAFQIDTPDDARAVYAWLSTLMCDLNWPSDQRGRMDPGNPDDCYALFFGGRAGHGHDCGGDGYLDAYGQKSTLCSLSQRSCGRCTG